MTLPCVDFMDVIMGDTSVISLLRFPQFSASTTHTLSLLIITSFFLTLLTSHLFSYNEQSILCTTCPFPLFLKHITCILTSNARVFFYIHIFTAMFCIRVHLYRVYNLFTRNQLVVYFRGRRKKVLSVSQSLIMSLISSINFRIGNCSKSFCRSNAGT